MKFKVEYMVVLTEDEARELAEESGTEDDAIDDPEGTTAENLLVEIENSSEFDWSPDNVKVNFIQ